VLVVGLMGLEPTTPCLQSQIGQGRHLARRRAAQVMAAAGLAVGIRMRPLASIVNGTVVARPARMTFVRLGGGGTDSTAGKARLRRRCIVGEGHRLAAGVG